jgi:putative endonuclease
MAYGHELGRWGESLAWHFLQNCGYELLGRGFRRAGGEIDLVVRRQGWLVFVEVKTRNSGCPAPPEAWVTRRKLFLLRRMARIWLLENPGSNHQGVRFDVIGIEFGGEGRGCVLRHLRGVA